MATVPINEAIPLAAEKPARSLWQDAWNRLLRNRIAIAAIVVILLFVGVAIFADVLAPHPYAFQSRARDNRGNGGVDLPPYWVQTGDPKTSGKEGYWLGTDGLGRDVLSRVIYGARVSMAVGFIPVLITQFLGILVGVTAGYLGGRIDNLLMRITDVVYAFPDLLFIIIVVTALRTTAVSDLMGGLLLILVALSIISWVGVARLIRGQILSLREKEFVEAARSIGTPTWRIMLGHLLPNSMGPLIVAATFAIPSYIITEAVLGYIGISVKPPFPTWGSMINDGYNSISSSPHMVWVPATCIALVTLAFTFLGDGLRDALDPKMKQ